jgi:hypothetical protein
VRERTASLRTVKSPTRHPCGLINPVDERTVPDWPLVGEPYYSSSEIRTFVSSLNTSSPRLAMASNAVAMPTRHSASSTSPTWRW